MYDISIYWYDFVLAFIFAITSVMLLKMFYKPDETVSKVFFRALYFKYFFSILFCLIIVFVYGGVGDSISFFAESLLARDEVASGQLGFFEYLKFTESDFMDRQWYNHGAPSGAFLEKISFILSYPGCKSFLLTSLLFAFVAFFGVWKLYITTVKIFPDKAKILGLGILFFPSVCFYSSGIFKDTVSFSALGWFVFALYELSTKSSKNVKNWIICSLSLYIIYIVRSYVFYSIVLSLVFMIYERMLNSRKLVKMKLFLNFSFIVLVISLFYSFYSFIEQELLADFISEIASNKVLYDSVGGGSNYNIISGESFALSDLIKTLPISIFTTLFRPFLWESNSALMIISSLENTILFIYFISTLFKKGIVNFRYNMKNDILLPFFLMYVIAFSGLVSIYTSNFGTLIRYRISAMPLLIFIIVSIQLKKNETLKINKNETLKININ